MKVTKHVSDVGWYDSLRGVALIAHGHSSHSETLDDDDSAMVVDDDDDGAFSVFSVIDDCG